MPFVIHRKGEMPDLGEGEGFATRVLAVYSGKFDPKTQEVTYVPTEDETALWQERELERFRTGVYIPVPWAGRPPTSLKPMYEHFAHLSKVHPGMIAYTSSHEHGVMDRQTRVRPGKYLNEFYANFFSPETIEDYTTQCQVVDLELKFATTPDEIEQVYTNGPESCMRIKDHSFESPFPPVRVYGDSDLSVAYYGPIDNVLARAVVWPERKIFTICYGQSERLKALLEAAGYERGTTVAGARIRAVREGGQFVVPYIDLAESCNPDGKWLVLCEEPEDGGVCTKSTTGLGACKDTCDECGVAFATNDQLCEECWNDCHFSCAGCGGWYDTDDEHPLVNGDSLCESCYDAAHVACQLEGCDCSWIERNLTSDQRSCGCTQLCPEHRLTHAYCDKCDLFYELGSEQQDDLKNRCEQCNRMILCADDAQMGLLPEPAETGDNGTADDVVFHPGGPFCYDNNNDSGFYCTREPDHPGQHVAHTGAGIILKRWDPAPTPQPQRRIMPVPRLFTGETESLL